MTTAPPPSQAYLDQYDGNIALDLSIAFIVIITVVFIARQFCRYVLKKGAGFGADDILLPFAWLFCTGMWIITIVEVKLGGVGHHFQELLETDPAALTVNFKCIFALELTYLCAISLTKLAILTLYLRIFVDTKARIIIWALIAYITSFWIAAFLVDCLQANPISYVWDPTIPGGYYRINSTTWVKAIGPIELAPDLPMLLLPVWSISKLNMSKGKKLGMIVVLTAGVIGTAFGIVRTVVFYGSSIYGDPTWQDVSLGQWANLEPSLYFLAACLPGCYSLATKLTYDNLRSMGSRVRSTFSGSRGSQGSQDDSRAGNTYNGTTQDGEEFRMDDFTKRSSKKELAARLAGDTVLDSKNDTEAGSPIEDSTDSRTSKDGSLDNPHDVSIRSDVLVSHKPRRSAEDAV